MAGAITHQRKIDETLIRLASPRPSAEALISALAGLRSREIDPMIRAIAYHRVEGLAHRAISRLPEGSVDPGLRSRLARSHGKIAAATRSQGLALAELLDSLDRRGVEAIVMRGLRSVESIYADPGARPFEDHDLLVRPRDLPDAEGALRALGFRREGEGLHRRGGTIVDLHVDPLGARRRPSRARVLPVPVETLFQRAAAGRVAGAPALVADLCDELVLIAVHIVKHSFDRLIRVADLAHLIARRGDAIDWREVRRRAGDWGAFKLVGWAVEAASALEPCCADAAGFVQRGGRLERLLINRARRLRFVPYSGEILTALAARSWGDGLLFLADAFMPAGEAPAGALGRAAYIPGRALGLIRQAAAQGFARREAR